ncbi:putative desulfatase [Pedobacter sp. BAL39]|uniref:phosphotransferase enzyme family protein n=1 Tax=Pedobacter sp. BAL39 TaxID=391596 RepID=UPI00015597C9|nr:aminoglycoside phosphotransferase family protein [Pedobacter sp. BAL39]EDM37711.1 putative desulfatase [Pedobacter sp. BAL39]
MQSVKNIAEVISQFRCDAAIDSLEAYGSGHINDTYFIKNISERGSDYLLQRINHQIFKDVAQLTENMIMVTCHLKQKLMDSGDGDPEKEVMTLIPAESGKYYYKDSQGDYWRMCYFLKNTRSYDLVETEKQAFEGGKAFGRFQAMLSDMTPGVIHEVIPDFHNIEKRLEQLNEAIREDRLGRLTTVEAELETVRKYAASMRYFQEPAQQQILPRRVIHNDTKFNNVLLNEHDEAQCVIDLDTVMDGYVAFDFGDAIRTIINTAEEDEADLSKIQLNLPLFNAYTQGYFKTAASFITDAEVQSLIKGVLLLPYMQAVRFLTDHINGDQYFKVRFGGHNLQRTRAQLQLLKLLDANSDLLQTVIAREMAYQRQHNV